MLHEKPVIPRRIKECIIEAARASETKDEFIVQLKKRNISVVFRETDKCRIYGTTFVDNESGIVLNGSRLGKAYSSNVFEKLFNDPATDKKALLENMEAGIHSQAIGIPEHSGREKHILPELLQSAAEAVNILSTGLENQPIPVEEWDDIQNEILNRKKRKKKQKVKL
ncbi:hypothetical protein [Alistipes indistinctus]|uniref:Uncharacterized protein n=1 Tax=Alistipes indistinctus YIT 12060 TaxID=742725 RepID=G5HBC1_9BACT|nr:hypothetical protein [Alistipes indistinctus]EHB91887.1 hypothetical protein HMPREF9450_01936 [Alistipes indistinctus YIT 12060]UWN59662.1 hypothetical protein NQ495_01540 [Alistipes indistinctus YIT 12060]